MTERLDRRALLQRMAALGLAVAATEVLGWSGAAPVEAAQRPRVYVARGGSPASRVRATFRAMGGVERFVRRGSHVVLKPAIGFARGPEIGANTNPMVVGEVVRLCLAAGAKSVRVYENPCDLAAHTFRLSGIAEAVQDAGGEIYPANQHSLYRTISIPRGRVLHTVEVVKAVLDADVFINLPVAKVHSATAFSLGLKNLMGVVWDRATWHRQGLDQCIADFATVLRPTLTMVDATRTLLTRGPQGPGKVALTQTLIASTHPVAADAVATTLFGARERKFGYLVKAHEMGLGPMDPGLVDIVKV